MGREVELKYGLRDADIKILLGLPQIVAWAQDEPRKHQLISTYYDTPELDLAHASISLRIRKVGAQWVQTLKSKGTKSAGLSVRDEFESEIDDPILDLGVLEQTAYGELLQRDGLGARLAPVFVTDFERLSLDLVPNASTRIELAIDRGEIRAGKLREPISELELELKAGTTDGLLAAAATLGEHLELRPEDRSKASRGYHLVDPAAWT